MLVIGLSMDRIVGLNPKYNDILLNDIRDEIPLKTERKESITASKFPLKNQTSVCRKIIFFCAIKILDC